jgi:hypothetical protein
LVGETAAWGVAGLLGEMVERDANGVVAGRRRLIVGAEIRDKCSEVDLGNPWVASW